ncbi:MAG: recombinase family protein, partial [Synechocystis sp.]|nr:recombinase family protein [Synechocystis sp.]
TDIFSLHPEKPVSVRIYVSFRWYDLILTDGVFYERSEGIMALIGYARCSTNTQDLTAQRQQLVELGVEEELIYVDKGLTGTNRNRPGLDQALAAVRKGDTLVVPKLDRLARSVPDAPSIADFLMARGVSLALGTTVYDPGDPMGKMFFNILATFAEFESDLIRMQTREGMVIARSKVLYTKNL